MTLLNTPPRSAILLMHCADQSGLVASVTAFIHHHGGNILHLDQHVDTEHKIFFMRVEWDLQKFTLMPEVIGIHFRDTLATPFNMQWSLHFSDEKPRMAIFVSKLSHCLYDILSHSQSGDWPLEISMIFSNHTDLEPVAKTFGIPFYVFPINEYNRREQEQKQLDLLKEKQIECIALARYMQILSPEFISAYPQRIINIHHSFLPAFPGAKPYHSAYARGVKMIGATSHYVTEDLDAGPIIDQDVTFVTHKDDVKELIRKGQDLEKIVLSRALWAHITRRVLSYGNRTVIF